MKKEIKMPKLSENMEKGVLAGWNIKIGDRVKKGDIIFEVETDKVVSEIESMEEGILKESFFEEGDEVKVGETIAVIEG
ncbi:biotin/lipoyl-containing protein [Candidatus Clostridium radicumherbarum]|uniref:Biotin/lipoyl-containing protein n=1 Tax=Candidatus Clostridium radicumherbarum TaxID=3381662 RepID=A0ABW8TWL1_9CLOT